MASFQALATPDADPHGPRSAPRGRAAGAPPSILVVDDSRSIRAVLCGHLAALGGFRIETASSLAETRALITRSPERFFCAALDVNLPDAPDGEVIDLVRATGTPVIVLTASVDDALRSAMEAKQVVDYVVKRNPHEIEHVAQLIARLHDNRSRKVLIVEDSPSFRLYLDALLRRHQYQTLLANDGREAMKQLEEHPDTCLVVTDINMPEMDGMQLIEAIRSRHRRESLAIIGVSDRSRPGLSAQLLKLGANDFLAKPFEVEEFYCRIAQNVNMVSYVREMRESASRDYLTGVSNRRHLFEIGEPLHASARRGELTLAAAVIDADQFKRINDTFGHHAGDEALIAIASTLRAGLPDTAVVARYGGEEFVCLVGLRQPAEAMPVFERLRGRIESTVVEVQGRRVPFTVSIGVSTTLGESLADMLRRADEGTYRAKQAGRNRVVVA